MPHKIGQAKIANDHRDLDGEIVEEKIWYHVEGEEIDEAKEKGPWRGVPYRWKDSLREGC